MSTLTYFQCRGRKLAFGTCKCAPDDRGRMPKSVTDEHVVWIWNGYFWGLLVRHCESFEDALKRANDALVAVDARGLDSVDRAESALNVE